MDLSTATHVHDFIPMLNSSSRSDRIKEALSKAAAEALAKTSDPSHVSELARFLGYVPTDIGLAALEKSSAAENEAVTRCEQRVRNSLSSQKAELKSKLQLARATS